MFSVILFCLILTLLSILYECQANCPNGVIRYGVSNQERNVILNQHNNFRKMIANGQIVGQPRGINLKRMSWDACLASEAQRIANTCEYAHQTATCPKWSSVGQNLYTSYTNDPSSQTSDWRAAVDYWTNEHKKYTFGSPFSKETGHYTQVVWANSNKVGCGFTFFKGSKNYQKLYVCNYGPPGNVRGQNPYNVGTSGCENLC